MRVDAREAVAHGGDVDAARVRFPGAPEPWVDLSTGINPEPYPVTHPAQALWARLPQPSDVRRLQEAAQRRYRAACAEQVVCAPGTQAIIQVLPTLVPQGRVQVLGPTYGEHVAAWRRAGHDVAEVRDVAALGGAGVRAVVVVNPDNPTGRIVAADAVRDLAGRLHGAGGVLVVDEAFADVAAEGVSVVPRLPPAAVVLRSFGKMYGLAGLRLGFAVASGEMAAQLRDALGPWPVSGPALAIGAAALGDDAWLDAARERLRRDAARLDRLLAASEASVIGGTTLFRLAAHDDAPWVADRLGEAGILVRTFAHAPTWLRFGLPGDAEAWRRLEDALGGRKAASASPFLPPSRRSHAPHGRGGG